MTAFFIACSKTIAGRLSIGWYCINLIYKFLYWQHCNRNKQNSLHHRYKSKLP